ncbi:hypothetical protein [Synechococcus sp. CC9605]|uniref:hypothetical protein n=1 Tax=Synechococcus sp. (strain CC9605) TaxID=110662 RepID=UPI00005D5770|nr:hypothetical protein [Synechococcus sp. CC9605]ABB34313.1 hypothetical protein Syncc9605_0539 [Synechococcus sp. CC9605]
MTSIKEAQFPATPSSGELRKKYGELREAAQFLSRSRGQYKGQVTRLTTRITEMECELRQFASAAEMTLRQKAELDNLLLNTTTSLKALRSPVMSWRTHGTTIRDASGVAMPSVSCSSP